MPRPRKQLVDPTRTPYYHVTSRCVRRAYLCGSDKNSGVSYEHRKRWIEQRIRILSSIFALDVCAYAVMSNHYHLVIRLNPAEVGNWSNLEVLERWHCLYQESPLLKRYAEGDQLTLEEHSAVNTRIELFRSRLGDLSWFMRALNEPIARMANKEDNCTGHFWESRFCSQALTTTAALMACMAYVDLNPVRAGVADKPSSSKHTSYRERIAPSFNLRKSIRSQFITYSLREFSVELKPLMKFSDQKQGNSLDIRPTLPFSFRDYRELMIWTYREKYRKDNKTDINTQPNILVWLNLSPQQWLIDSEHFEVLHRLGAFTRQSDDLTLTPITEITTH